MTGALNARPAIAADHTVSQAGKEFAPGGLTIQAGDTITFVNDDLTIQTIDRDRVGTSLNFRTQARFSDEVVVERKVTRVVDGPEDRGRSKRVVPREAASPARRG